MRVSVLEIWRFCVFSALQVLVSSFHNLFLVFWTNGYHLIVSFDPIYIVGHLHGLFH